MTGCWCVGVFAFLLAVVLHDWQSGRIDNKSFLMAALAWLVVRGEYKVGNQAAEHDLMAQLRYRSPSSLEYAAYQRGAFDE